MPIVLANAGVPMLFVQWPVMVLALIPILLVEAGLLRWRLALPLENCIRGSLIANLVSTFVGIPLTWIGLVCAEFAAGTDRYFAVETPLQRIVAVTLQAPWLGPHEHELRWMVPAASLVLLIPFLATSVIVEGLILTRLWRDLPRRRVWAAALMANGVSYGLLMLYAAVCLNRSLGSPPWASP